MSFFFVTFIMTTVIICIIIWKVYYSFCDQFNALNLKVHLFLCLQTSQAQLRIHVLDCNDNSPIFRVVPSLVYIDENQPGGATLYRVEGQDLDKGENGFISYSLANVDDVPFAIDHFTGVIHVKEALDFETMRRSYSLVVRASDWGNPFRRETDVILKVRVYI